MKKVIAILLVCIMTACTLCGCVKNEQTQAQPETQTQTQTQDQGQTVGLPNPMVEVADSKAMEDQLGVGLGPVTNASDVKYYVISGEMGEMQCMLDSTKITARVKASAEYEDISGIYAEYDHSEEWTINGRQGNIYDFTTDEGTTEVCLWFDAVPGIMYCVTASAADLDGFDITAIAQQVFAPVQGEA